MDGVRETIEKFKHQTILVIGDVVLDKYIWGDVKRISPEAPVQVVHVKNETFVPGCAGNVACNISALGARCFIVGLVGNDNAKDLLKSRLESQGVDASGLCETHVPTIQKTRIIAGHQQLLRIDHEIVCENAQEDKMIDFIERHLNEIDLIAVSDYAKGVVTPKIMEYLVKCGKPVVVDPKPKNMNSNDDLEVRQLYAGVEVIKPNIGEAEIFTGMKASSEEHVAGIGRTLMKMFNANVVLTRGKDGISVFEKSGEISQFPTRAREVFDVTGAGDTVMAALCIAKSTGASLKEAAIIANHAGGIKVGKVGTAVVTAQELAHSFEKEFTKLKSADELSKIVEDLKLKKKKIVFTSGCFDILHVGHTRLLQKAKSFGDVLILGLNSDESVRRLKGSNRPIIQEKERAELLSSLEFVDYVVFFNEDTPLELVRSIKPHTVVKGGNYSSEEVFEKDVPRDLCEVKIIPFVEGFSVTSILNKIKNEQ